MKRLIILIIFNVSLLLNAANKEDSLFVMAKLYGVSQFVLENESVSKQIVNTSLQYLNGQKAIDYDRIVDQLMPKAPKENYKTIDTSKYLIVCNPNVLLKSRFFSTSSLEKIRYIILAKDKSLKVIKKELDLVKFEGNMSLQELDSVDALEGFFRLWNAIDYYYPYKKSLEVDWDIVFQEYLPIFTSDSIGNYRVYVRQLYRLSAEINDNHVKLDKLYDKKKVKKHSREFKKKEKSENKGIDTTKFLFYPYYLKMIEGKLYVSNKIPTVDLKGIDIGSRVLEVNNKTPEEIIDIYQSKEPSSRLATLIYYMNNSQRWLHFVKSDSLVFKIEGVEAELTIHRVPMTQSQFFELASYNDSPNSTEGSNYVYLDLSTKSKKEFKSKMKRSAKNNLPLILDARAYPSKLFVVQIAKYFSSKPIDVVSISLPFKHYPGFYKTGIDQPFYFTNMADFALKSLRIIPAHWNLFYPLTKKVTSPVIVLMSERTMSWGESMVMLIDKYAKGATLIGRNTKGANGNIGVVELPGKIEMSYTHYKLDDIDGNNYQNVGIPTDIYVPEEIPTKQNTNRDIIFETALRTLKEKQAVLK